MKIWSWFLKKEEALFLISSYWIVLCFVLFRDDVGGAEVGLLMGPGFAPELDAICSLSTLLQEDFLRLHNWVLPQKYFISYLLSLPSIWFKLIWLTFSSIRKGNTFDRTCKLDSKLNICLNYFIQIDAGKPDFVLCLNVSVSVFTWWCLHLPL